MDTRAIAARLGVEPKTLRRFIRSRECTFTPCGSGGRYQFEDTDLPVLAEQLAGWLPRQATKPAKTSPAVPRQRRASDMTRDERDAVVWAEEGPLQLPDIHNPHVRATVRAIARAQERRLEEQLMAAGLHVSQWGARTRV